MREDPVELAALLAPARPGLRIQRYRHGAPCGPHRDPGPHDDWGSRWHWCYQITYEGTVWTGRRDEAITYLEELARV
jgi:hypothetical protein